jgi:uncharacterized protein (TIGR02145 family)
MNSKLTFPLLIITFLFLSSCKKAEETPTNSLLNSDLTYGSVIDIDGNEYATIKIGDQVWMAENLKTTRYANGNSIPNLVENWQWIDLSDGGWCHYNNDSSYDDLYGKLYSWYTTVPSNGNVCPEGWHVPSFDEWVILSNQLGGESIAARSLKTTLSGHWIDSDVSATNESGFSALPSGGKYKWGFMYHTEGTQYWSTSQKILYDSEGVICVDDAYVFGLSGYYDDFYNTNTSKNQGFCIRCIMD